MSNPRCGILELAQGIGRATLGEPLQRFSARLHQDDDEPGKRLAEDCRGHDCKARHEISRELPSRRRADTPPYDGESCRDESQQPDHFCRYWKAINEPLERAGEDHRERQTGERWRGRQKPLAGLVLPRSIRVRLKLQLSLDHAFSKTRGHRSLLFLLLGRKKTRAAGSSLRPEVLLVRRRPRLRP